MITTIHGVQFSIIELIIVPVMFTLVSLRFAISSTHKIKIWSKTRLDLFILFAGLFLVSICISWFYALDQEKVLKIALKWVEIFGIASVVFLYSSTLKRFRDVWWLLVMVYLVSVFLAFASLLTRGSEFSYTIARSLPGYPALFLLCLLIPFIRKPLISFVLLVLGASVVASLTRGAWIGLVWVVTYWMWKLPKKRVGIATILGIGIILAGLMFTMPGVRNVFSYKIAESIAVRSASNRERFGMAITCAKAFAQHPFTGIGAGNFSSFMLQNGVPAFVNSPNPEALTPHNFFLQIAAENGIIGLFAVLGLFFMLYRILFSPAKIADRTPYMQGLKFHFIPLLISILFGYVAGEVRLILGLYIGLVLACLRTGVSNRSDYIKKEN